MKAKTSFTGSISLPKSIVVRKGEIVQDEEFVAFVMAQKRLEEQVKNNWALIQKLMEDKKVATVKGDWGFLTLGNKKSLVATEPLPPRFYRLSLDSAKLEAYKKLHGEYPKNVQRTDSRYLAKRILI